MVNNKNSPPFKEEYPRNEGEVVRPCSVTMLDIPEARGGGGSQSKT